MTSVGSAKRTNSASKIWQFTLREMIFGLIAICAVVALVPKWRGFSATKFISSFDEKKLLAAAATRTGKPLDVRGASFESSFDSRSARRVISFRMSSPKSADAGRFVYEVRKEIRKLLRDAGCSIFGVGIGGSLEAKSVADFSFAYRNETAYGEIYVHSIVGDRDEWTMFLFVWECPNE